VHMGKAGSIAGKVSAPRIDDLPYRSARTSRSLNDQINIVPGISRIPARNH